MLYASHHSLAEEHHLYSSPAHTTHTHTHTHTNTELKITNNLKLEHKSMRKFRCVRLSSICFSTILGVNMRIYVSNSYRFIHASPRNTEDYTDSSAYKHCLAICLPAKYLLDYCLSQKGTNLFTLFSSLSSALIQMGLFSPETIQNNYNK